jgi:hypothetical protein
MVKFFDPITKEEITYYIAPNLLPQWDNLKDGKLQKQDEDRVYITDGRERAGKSLFTLQQAKYLDPTFDISRVCFTPEEFLFQIRNAPAGSAIVFDEAFRGLSSKASQSKVNKTIVQAMMEMGQKNLIVFIVLPTFFLLEMYAAVLRANVLFHIYKDRSGRRRFRIYNYKKKSWLYKVGKKKGFDYSFPRISRRHTGRFYGVFPIDEKSYRKKKLDSLKGFEQIFEEDTGTEKFHKAVGGMIKAEKKINPKISDKKMVKILKEKYFIDVSLTNVGVIRRKTRETTQNL